MPALDVAGVLLVQLIWGFHFAIAKLGLREVPALFLMGLRFTAVAALLCPFFRLPRHQIKPVFALSLTFGSLNFGLMYAGVAHLDASTAAIIGQAQVPFTAILAAYVYGDRFGWRRLAGLTLSFLGIVLVVGEPKVGDNYLWVAAVLGSAFVSALGNVQIKSLGPINSFALTGWVAVFTAPQLLAASFLLESGQWDAALHSSWRAWLSLGYTVLIVAIGSYALWYPLVRRYPLNQVLPFTLLIPVFGVISGLLIQGESLSLQSLLGALATIAGVAIIILRRPPPHPKPPPKRETENVV